MQHIKLEEHIRTVPDYPIKGINFYDLNSLFASKVFNIVIEQLAKQIANDSRFDLPTHVVGVESRGFVIGSVLAKEMSLPFVMIRKENSKYPGELYKESYNLEYGSNTLVLQKGILGHTSRVIIADDLIATGGSLLASKKLCESSGAKVLGVTALLDLTYIETYAKEQLKPTVVHTSIFETENND
jgi:adenine phosphoribosyltransferase